MRGDALGGKAQGFAQIGCGLIGGKRAASLRGGELLYACDLDEAKARALASKYPPCEAVSDLQKVLNDGRVHVVIVSTLNGSLSEIATAAVAAGKHVLVEKPGALSAKELEAVEVAARKSGALVRIGYNHRFHPALQKAKALVAEGAIGPVLFMRGRYGHGGRTGYDREWRADPALSGGGELIDQGVHLIDLAGWYLGESWSSIEGHAATLFWDMPVDDNAFLSLRTESGKTAWLQVSCTEWKNLFSLEIYGRDGKLAIDGLGGSYGLERLAFYKMLPEMGPPETTIWEYPRGDASWRIEMETFLEDVRLGRQPEPGLAEGIQTMKVVEEIYRRSGYVAGAKRA